MLCNSNVGMVRALAKKHPGKFEISERPKAEHQEELDELRIESHGVVCKLGDAVLWKHGDHKLTQEKLDEGLKVVLGKLK